MRCIRHGFIWTSPFPLFLREQLSISFDAFSQVLPLQLLLLVDRPHSCCSGRAHRDERPGRSFRGVCFAHLLFFFVFVSVRALLGSLRLFAWQQDTSHVVVAMEGDVPDQKQRCLVDV